MDEDEVEREENTGGGEGGLPRSNHCDDYLDMSYGSKH